MSVATIEEGPLLGPSFFLSRTAFRSLALAHRDTYRAARLIADPHFRGAGLHLTLRGGHLALHADFNRDRFRALSRRLTVLYYLNPGWEPAWGGDLELWNADLSRCETRIAPRLDRLVVMAHGDDHWHGHPAPLECLEGRGRAAVAAYFYTAEAPPGCAGCPRRHLGSSAFLELADSLMLSVQGPMPRVFCSTTRQPSGSSRVTPCRAQ